MNIVDKPRKFYLFLVLSYGMLIFLTIEILTWVLYFNFENNIKENNDIASRQNLSLISFTYENLYAEARATCEQIYIENDVKKLRYGNTLEPLEVTNILSKLVSYSVVSPNLLSVYIYSRASNLFYDSNKVYLSSTDEFFDKGIVDILTNMKKSDSSLIPIIVEDASDSNQPTKNTKAYTMILSDISKNPTSVDSAVIMNFKENWISGILQDTRFDQTSEYIILNQEGLIVGGSGNESFLTTLDDTDLQKSILNEHLNSFQYKINGSNYLVNNVFSDKLNWNIIKLTKLNLFNEKNIIIRNITTLVSIVVLLIALVILLILSKNAHSSVKNVLGRLNDLELEKKGSYNFLRNTFLKKFLDEYMDPLILIEGMEKYNIAFSIESPLTLIILKIDNLKLFYTTYNSKEREFILLKIKEMVIEGFSGGYKYEVIEYDKDCLFIITNSTSYQAEEIKALMIKLQTNVCNIMKSSISCVVGNLVNDYEDIPVEMNNINELMNYKLIYGYSSIILSSEFLKVTDTGKYEYQFKNEKQLFDQLLLGKLDNAIEIFLQMVNDAKKYSYNTLMIMLNRLIFATYNIVEKLGIESKALISFDFYSFSKTINTLETLDDIIWEFKQVFESISNSLITDSNNRYSKIVSKIYNYIETNYSDPNLSVNLIADYIDKLPVYMNRIFKNSTGRSVQSFIDDFRLKKSMELLARTSLSIKEICNEIGMPNEKYYYVLFKKSLGLTPGEYRSRENDRKL